MPRKSKYARLLRQPQIRRWHANVSRGSLITADVNLRRLGAFCNEYKITPRRLTTMDSRQLHGVLIDMVTAMETRNRAGSYISSTLKSVKSWLAFNDVFVRRPIKIRGVNSAPTLRNEKVPTQAELKNVFLAGDPRSRLACALMGMSGLRPEVLGNYTGHDGLRLGDFPDLRLDGGIRLERTPARVVVRRELSKTDHAYFSFLCEEGCRYLVAYLKERAEQGEELKPESPLITPKSASKQFIVTTNISDIARGAIRKAGYRFRPYALRYYFARQMMLAEAKSYVIRDWRQFFMGHKGDIEHRYTLNNCQLPDEVIHQMRESYALAARFLQTEITEDAQSDAIRRMRRDLLMVAGFVESEITDTHLSLDEHGFRKLAQDKLETSKKRAVQKVIATGELEQYLADGWEFLSVLPDGRLVVREGG